MIQRNISKYTEINYGYLSNVRYLEALLRGYSFVRTNREMYNSNKCEYFLSLLNKFYLSLFLSLEEGDQKKRI